MFAAFSRRMRIVMAVSAALLVAVFIWFVWLATHTTNSAATGASATATITAFRNTPGNSLPTPTRAPITSPAFVQISRSLTATPGGTLTTAIVAEPRTLQPYLSDDPAIGLLYNAGLVRRDPATQAMIPLAARSFTISPDGSSVSFTLRDDIKWSDGTPITANDYVWTYGRITDSTNGWPYLADLAPRIVSYTAPDARTIVVKLKATYADPADAANIVEPLPKHIWQNLDWRDPKASTTPQVVSGAWKLAEWVKGDHLTFARNEASTVWPIPFLQSVTVRIAADPQVIAQGFAAGQYDFMTPDAATYQTVRYAGANRTYTWSPAAAQWLYVGFNLRRPALTLPVRQAFALIAPRKATDDTGFPTVPMYADVPPGNVAYSAKDVQPQTGDVAAAKKVLTDVGYTQDATGWKDPKGVTVPALTLLYSGEPGSERATRAAEVRDQIVKLGFNLTLDVTDSPTYRQRLTAAPDSFDLWLGGWRSPVEASAFGETWTNLALNYGGYTNGTVIGLYAAAAKEFDRNRRTALMAQIQQAETKDPPYIYLYAQQGVTIASSRIGGISPTPFGIAANLMTDWYIGQ